LARLRLYLVRHAEAARGEPDDLRPLTASGRAAARSLGARLAADGVRPGAVLTSPLLRARIVAELGGGPEPAFPPAGLVVLEL
jgi:phosphohistidine phosphatase SixA